MQASDVHPVFFQVENGPTAEIYFVDPVHERSFLTCGDTYRQLNERLPKKVAGRKGTVTIVILSDGKGLVIGKDRIEETRKHIAALRNSQERLRRSQDEQDDALAIAFLLTAFAVQGIPNPNEDCSKCPVTLCLANTNYGASPA